jgi:hypothetical protein
MSEQKIQAVIDYGERLKLRSENDILYDKMTSFWHIQIRNVIIVMAIIYYFRNLIIEKKTFERPETFPIQTERFENYSQIENYSQNNMRFLM